MYGRTCDSNPGTYDGNSVCRPERHASGGDGLLNKAASGFKDKVKYKLTGGGGGGLMKGIAKAGGGLLRRPAGR